MAKPSAPFEFKQCTSIIKATGMKARDLKELRTLISIIDDASIFHHTYQYFLKGHIMEYTNDFAHWAGEGLEERALSEHLSNIDIFAYKDISELRAKLLAQIDTYSEKFPEPREAMEGDEFYFNETVTLVFPVGIRVKNLAELLMAIKHVDAGSIYYHFYEARVRLGEGVDDFSAWIKDVFQKTDLVKKISGIDLFMHNVEGIREHLLEFLEDEVQRDMEVVHR
ncbi:MAG: hypothetical protein BMS9Abin23_0511 [Thermodesulfobacteriota bacterium]|nr:MAG: hypothetical protein BMS9Abin23_0511 [Thermodesulfobacteriota bacterium]